jgi:hypothetical protein
VVFVLTQGSTLGSLNKLPVGVPPTGLLLWVSVFVPEDEGLLWINFAGNKYKYAALAITVSINITRKTIFSFPFDFSSLSHSFSISENDLDGLDTVTSTLQCETHYGILTLVPG